MLCQVVYSFPPGIQIYVTEPAPRHNRWRLDFPSIDDGQRFHMVHVSEVLDKMVFTTEQVSFLVPFTAPVVVRVEMLRLGSSMLQ